LLAPPGAVDVDIRQKREGRAHPSPFTITRLYALFPSCKFGPPADRRGLARLRSCSCIIAFDLIELNGDGLLRDPLQVRKAALTSTLAKAGPGIRFNEHLECDDGEIVFRHACKLGLEGMVSKRKDSPYRSGRSSAGSRLRIRPARR
jgi:hypothetical protein